MDFNTNEVSHLHRHRQHGAHIFQVCEQGVGIFVTFTTKNFIAVNAEFVKEVSGFVARFRDKFRQNAL